MTPDFINAALAGMSLHDFNQVSAQQRANQMARANIGNWLMSAQSASRATQQYAGLAATQSALQALGGGMMYQPLRTAVEIHAPPPSLPSPAEWSRFHNVCERLDYLRHKKRMVILRGNLKVA